MDSSSNCEFNCIYDIFLSFRGLDTRKKFTDHLYEALKREGFQTFRDDDEIERGENIKSELRKAITNSRMSVIVLSENYAKSTACLFEIQTILEHREKSDHLILPVFYEMDPGKIKEQAKNLNFLAKKVRVEEVNGWSVALKEVARMAGMVSLNRSNGYEAKFIEEIVGEIKSKLAGKHLRVADRVELDENMQKLRKKVEYLSGQENDIKAEISSAKRQQWKRPKKEVEVWLREVQRLIDDVQRLEQEVIGKMTFSSVALLGKRIVEKIQEATELQENRRVFNDLLIDELPTGRLLIPPTKDFVKSTKGRNIEKVWECLMNDEVGQIGVYGMGGIGKTTIMKHIHNQLLEETCQFDCVFWVRVSKPFNIIKLQRDIAKELNINLWDDENVTRRASQLYDVLSRIKKYVLILDDVWEPFPLEIVGIPEPITQSNGCRIVLTTRLLDVCRRMDFTPIKVELLTEQEAFTLFLIKAVGNDAVLAPEVEEVAADIVKQCACLPLAIVTIGGSLRDLKGICEWRNALNELISSTNEVTNGVTEVFEQLKFSYSRLGDKVLQDCFLYCSLYPEDRFIPVEQLIEYWIAEGLIAEMNSVEAQFNKGHAILGKLTSSCLLESSTDRDGIQRLSMHDLIRDMALRITSCSPRFMVKAGERLECVPYEDWSQDLDKISLMQSWMSELPVRPPVCPRLTTLLLSYISLQDIPDSFFTNMRRLEVLDLSSNEIHSLPKSISNLENLHALILEDCHYVEYVPSLKKLKALKVFKLTKSSIEKVPEGIEELVNLRKLDMSYNERLGTFSSWKLRRLSKLQYLRIDGTRVKLSAADLLCLRQLKFVAVHFENVQEVAIYVTSQQCQGLEKYRLLVGEGFSEHKVVGKEVRIKTRYDKPYFMLDNQPRCINEPSGILVDQLMSRYEPIVDKLVLPAHIDFFQLHGVHDLISLSAISSLKDARNLCKCDISFCIRLESIFSSSLFDGIAPQHSIGFNLKELSIEACGNVKNILPVEFLQNFPNLRSLEVTRCWNVEDIIAEMHEGGNHQAVSNSINLPKLKRLSLVCLPRLRRIYNGVMVCQSIEEVVVVGCPMLKTLPLSLHMDSKRPTAPPSLQRIEVEQKWWESLEWEEPVTKTILQPFLKMEVEVRDLELERFMDRQFAVATRVLPNLFNGRGSLVRRT